MKGEDPGAGVELNQNRRTKPSHEQKETEAPLKKEPLCVQVSSSCPPAAGELDLWLRMGGRSVAATRVLTSDSCLGNSHHNGFYLGVCHTPC